MVCHARATLSLATHLFPLQDYLAAPMPYLVGIQADCLPLLRGTPLEEVVMFDLDCLVGAGKVGGCLAGADRACRSTPVAACLASHASV